MSASRENEGEDANNISYPSPEAETMEAGPFYNTNGRDVVPEHQEHHDDQQQQHPQHQHAPDQMDVQDQGQNDVPPQEPDVPQQHVSRPANLEELQLAAQLGQGLAGSSMIHTTDPNMNVEDPNLRNIMPHPEPEQQHTSYVQEVPASDPMAQHPMTVPVGPPMPPQYPMGDNIPPRKRSKVSRACDECRRKKIKCDAQSDTGETPCSSCARSSIRCLFSRVPQKRGPSKGYIKELADRIHSIENKLESEGALHPDEIERIFASERPRAQSNEDANRKRPFSSISGEFTTTSHTQQTPWGAEHRPLQPSSTPSDYAGAAYNPSSLAPQPLPIKTDVTPSKPPLAQMDGPLPESDEVLEIDEGLLHSYLTTVQPVYPILPNNKARLQELLAQSPHPLRLAFSHALPAVVTPHSGDPNLASSLANEWENSEAPRTQAANIVHLQTLLLLAIEADSRGSSTAAILVGRAVGLANTMRLWRYTPMELPAEPDSDDQLCVRLWWSLNLLDRYHSVGTGRLNQIPDPCIVAPPGLENILGEVCSQLVRLSKFISILSRAVVELQPGASTTEPLMARVLKDYIENYREDLPAHIEPGSHPLVHLAYWHGRLLVALLTPRAQPSETLWPTKELINLLMANSHMMGPLLNHFVSLATMSLTKLVKLDESREDAVQLTKEILDKPSNLWEGTKDKLVDLTRPTSSAEAAASQGLQHLADLATAHEGIAPGTDDITFGPSLSTGYLNIV